MKKELKDKWLAALRSGEYKQGRKCLRDKDDEFCCLGVLCEVAGLKAEPGEYKYSYIYNDESVGYDWLPLRFRANNNISDSTEAKLAKLNDDGFDFLYIADYIETFIQEE